MAEQVKVYCSDCTRRPPNHPRQAEMNLKCTICDVEIVPATWDKPSHTRGVYINCCIKNKDNNCPDFWQAVHNTDWKFETPKKPWYKRIFGL